MGGRFASHFYRQCFLPPIRQAPQARSRGKFHDSSSIPQVRMKRSSLTAWIPGYLMMVVCGIACSIGCEPKKEPPQESQAPVVEEDIAPPIPAGEDSSPSTSEEPAPPAEGTTSDAPEESVSVDDTAANDTPANDKAATEDSETPTPEKTPDQASAEQTPTPRSGSSIVPPSRAYLPPNRNRNPLPVAATAKSDRELADERKAREAAKKRGEITFDDLKFDIEKDQLFKEEMLGKENWDLHGKNWKLRGFILPTTLFSQTGITEFVLVRDNQECCFGPGAALFDCVIVNMEPGKSISYTTRVVTVKGKLEIDTESFKYPDDEGHYAVYKMTAEEVK